MAQNGRYGRPSVEPDLIASVLGLARATVDEALREAVSLHVLLPRPKDGSERYSFRHALLQEAIYGELLPGERSRIHAELADVLTRSAPAARDAGLAAEIAHHREASHDVPGAFDAWLAAALAAEQLGALAQALAYLEHALDLWDRVPDAAARSPLDRVEVLRRAALLAEGATPAKSIAYVRQAIALVDPLVEPARAGLLHERLGQYGTYTTSLAARRAAYETAVRLVPPEPPSEERAWVLAGFGRFLGEIETASDLTIPICREAVAVAESVNARAAQVRALAGSAGRLPWWARWGKAWRPWQVPARSRRSCVTCTSSLVP